VWAVEDCRHVTSRLERDLLAAAERVVRVPETLLRWLRRMIRRRWTDPGRPGPTGPTAASAGQREVGEFGCTGRPCLGMWRGWERVTHQDSALG
jgi:hypothetical protein